MCSWSDTPNPKPTYQPPAGSNFLIFFMPVVTKVQTQSENVTFSTLPRVLSQFSCAIWSIWDCVCVCVLYSVYIYNAWDIRSSKQVTIMCRAWYLQHWWQENWILLCTARLVITLILERLLQHAEGLLDIQQAHENRTPVFSCWCVCVFAVLHMPCRCRQGERRRKGFLPTLVTYHAHQLSAHKEVRVHSHNEHTHKPRLSVWLTKTWLCTEQCGALLCWLYLQKKWKRRRRRTKRRRTRSGRGNSVTLVSCF